MVELAARPAADIDVALCLAGLNTISGTAGAHDAGQAWAAAAWAYGCTRSLSHWTAAWMPPWPCGMRIAPNAISNTPSGPCA
jgi:hypothetical protein